ncbi:hypothetical protein [Roseibium sp.]|uniref:hypothetical protein n=1 Tax=Roseibium sp. TaxID=1936156 RepID=UPI003BAF61CE
MIASTIRAAVLAGGIALAPLGALADTVAVTIPDNNLTGYVSALLTKALGDAGHDLQIEKADSDLTVQRMMKMLEDGQGIDLIWRGEDAALKEQFLEVNVNLTNGLKGYRVLFVRPDDKEAYADVANLDDFKAKGTIGGFGKNWNDVRIWAKNGLPTDETDGKWNPTIYKKLAAGGRGVDYFSRGITEIAVEAPQHPELAVEPHLGLVYDNDFRLYVSKTNPDLHKVLTDALTAAKESGAMLALLKETYPAVYDASQLNIDGRKVINLEMP